MKARSSEGLKRSETPSDSRGLPKYSSTIAPIIIFENGLILPNRLFTIGAKAMIGTEFAAMANGIMLSHLGVRGL